MQRRSTAVSGWVNFPVADPEWVNSGEGGTVVKLVVCDNRDPAERFGLCFGAGVIDHLTETYVGDDRAPPPSSNENLSALDALVAEQSAFNAARAYHYPAYSTEPKEEGILYFSREYLAVLVLGTTGWTGIRESNSEAWVCGLGDLSEEGKALYAKLKALYEGCELHLVTFIDT